MDSQPRNPAPLAEELFAQWLAEHGGEGASAFEAFLEAHPDHAGALRELYARWLQVDDLMRRAGLGGTLSERLTKRYGAEVEPAVALHAKEEAAAPFTDSVLRRLTGRALAAGRYQIRGEIARGGMGVVLRVWDEDLRRSLAMKVILGKDEASPSAGTPPVDSRLLARFLEEAQVTGQLDHPGIVPVHELGLDARGQVYFTMKLVKGQTLREVFDLVRDAQEGWTRTRALGVLLKVCEAMAYAHDKGVIHRDLKPGNVMVGKYGEVYVMDWGLARVLDQADERDLRIRPEPPCTSSSALQSERASSRGETPESPLYTMDGDVVGTPAYMSPEQARGDLNAMGSHSDVYALGAMLYHLLAGHMAYVPSSARLNNYAVWSAVQAGPPPAIASLAPDAPAELVAICEKAMAREVGKRYPDTAALARDLAAFVEGRVVAAYQTGAWAETKKWVQRNRALAASLGTVVVLLAGGLVTSLKLRTRADRNAALAAELAVESAENAARAQKQAFEADTLRQQADVREAAATERADALWAMEELMHFKTLDDDLDYARSQERPTYVWWLEQAHELVDGRAQDPARKLRRKPHLEDHRRFLHRVRTEARSPEDREKDWWVKHLTELIADLEELRGRIELAERSVNTPEAKARWNEAIEAISSSEKYGGLRLTPQLELVPLGPDPNSGLWEFAHLGTGEPAVRGSDGKLSLRPETGIVFVLLPAGRVPVEDGSIPTQLNEEQLDAFFLSKYEMTAAQWTRTSPGVEGFWARDVPLLPVYAVRWDECLGTLEHAGLFLRLPSEPQWEYGCRAGTTTPWWTGSDEDMLRSAENIGWSDETKQAPQTIGSLEANDFGLHDVHGNVSEWCSERLGNDAAVYRGGSYRDGVFLGLSGYRRAGFIEFRTDQGLRTARWITP